MRSFPMYVYTESAWIQDPSRSSENRATLPLTCPALTNAFQNSAYLNIFAPPPLRALEKASAVLYYRDGIRRSIGVALHSSFVIIGSSRRRPHDTTEFSHRLSKWVRGKIFHHFSASASATFSSFSSFSATTLRFGLRLKSIRFRLSVDWKENIAQTVVKFFRDYSWVLQSANVEKNNLC